MPISRLENENVTSLNYKIPQPLALLSCPDREKELRASLQSHPQHHYALTSLSVLYPIANYQFGNQSKHQIQGFDCDAIKAQ